MKQIIFKATMEGCGVVNFDDKGQKFNLINLSLDKYLPRDDKGNIPDNIKFGKKFFFAKKDENGQPIKDEDGKLVYDYGIKISRDCLRHAIFNNEVEHITPMIVQNDIVACNYYLSPVGLTRGYLNALRDDQGFKNTSCITVTDAKEVSGTKSHIEVGSASGERNDTSLFYTETIGDAKYEFEGFIDFKTLMFVVADPMFDRMGIHPDWITTGLTEKILHNFYGDFASPSVGYFTSSSKCLTNVIAEYGMVLNEELVVYLTKFLLKSIMGASIKRSNAYANVTSLSIKFVDNIILDKMDDENGWMELKTIEDIDNLYFKVDCPYEKASDEDIKTLEVMKEKYAKAVKESKEEKDRKKEEKKKAKEEAVKRKNNKETTE